MLAKVKKIIIIQKSHLSNPVQCYWTVLESLGSHRDSTASRFKYWFVGVELQHWWRCSARRLQCALWQLGSSLPWLGWFALFGRAGCSLVSLSRGGDIFLKCLRLRTYVWPSASTSYDLMPTCREIVDCHKVTLLVCSYLGPGSV